MITQLNTKLKSVEESLEAANKCESFVLIYSEILSLVPFHCFSIDHERKTNLIVVV